MSLHNYNIYDAYLYKYKKLILIITYTPGLDITDLITDISQSFNMRTIKLEGPNIIKKDNLDQYNYKKVNNNVANILKENDDKLNSNFKGYYGQGILLYGLSFPKTKIEFRADLHLHLSITQKLFFKLNSNVEGSLYDSFKDIISQNMINKYYNLKTDMTNEINDTIFYKIIDFIELKVYGKNYEEYSTKNKMLKENSQSEQSDQKEESKTSSQTDDSKYDTILNEITDELEEDSIEQILDEVSYNFFNNSDSDNYTDFRLSEIYR
jgi:hypothetical protein